MKDGAPDGMRSHGVAISGAHIGELGTVESLRVHLAFMRATDVVQAAAKLVIHLERLGGQPFGTAQVELVEALFPAEIADGMKQGLAAGGGRGGFDVIFFPGQLMTLQKLALAACESGPPTSFGGGTLVGHFVTAAAQVNDVRDTLVPVPPDEMTDIDLSIYGFRAGELNRIRFPPGVAGRAYRLWLDSPVEWPSGLEHPDDFCRRTLGVGFQRFVAIAAAPPMGRLELDLADPSQAPFNPEQYFAETRVDPREVVEVLQRLTFQSAPLEEAVGDPSTYWSFFDLADRPLLPCGDGIVVPASLRYSLERATTGVFWMLHAAHSGEVETLTTHFGSVFEAYCVKVAEGLASPSVTVSGEIRYGSRSARKLSADILITTISTGVPARVFVECRAGRPPRALFETASTTAFSAYLDDVFGKLRQLDRSIRDHIAGAFHIPNDLAGPDDAYLPLLVLDEPFQWTFTLKLVIDREIARQGWFGHPRVAMPIICGIDDFDALIGSCERGDDLASVMRAYLASDRMDPLDVTVHERSGLLRPSIYCIDGWERYFEVVKTELFG